MYFKAYRSKINVSVKGLNEKEIPVNILEAMNHYDNKYFDWQKDMGEFGGIVDLFKFNKYITRDMCVIDFGCGGGYLLHNISCNKKIGVEINDVARQNLDKFGIKSFKFADEVDNNWADCIISNHALEHVPDPLNQLLILYEKLKTGGKIVFVVPFDSYKFKSGDINFHLYSWSPMNLGNLFIQAGFTVLESKEIVHRWPPFYKLIYKTLGPKIFNIICVLYGYYYRNNCSQTRIVAQKQ